MTLSLRMRVALLLFAINALVAAVTLGFATRQSAKNQAETARVYDRSTRILGGLASNLVNTVGGLIDPAGEVNVPRILDWPSWSLGFADAILLNDELREVGGKLVPYGVALNPVGRARRSSTLDVQRIYAAIRRAIVEGAPIDGVEGGRVVPILLGGRAWGGCWYRLESPPLQTDLVRTYFLPAFLLSTLLLTTATFFVLRRLVLDPVANLARGARRVSEGELSVQLPVPSSRGELAGLVQAFNVMTARVADFNARLAEEVRRQTEQARKAEAAAMMQRRLAAMGELAAGIAHEINNPLGGLLNAVETLSRGESSPEKTRRYLELLHDGLERIRLTVGQLLRFTPREARRAPVDLARPVEDAIALVRHRAARQSVELSFVRAAPDGQPAGARGDGPALVEGQANELGQAVLNLLVNALDALDGRPNGRIAVHLWREGREWKLEVRDNGPGAPPDAVGRLADLFYTTKEPGKGTGLGLAIVHQVVTSHGGALELANGPNGGFRARVSLPAFAEVGIGAPPERAP
jgi:signal transduction histidine kinase